MGKTYRASVERPDGIAITVSIAVPDYTPDAGEFSELAQMGLIQTERIVDRTAEQRASTNQPF